MSYLFTRKLTRDKSPYMYNMYLNFFWYAPKHNMWHVNKRMENKGMIHTEPAD